ncbi:hypothetical protein BDV97DRAFT_370216 [Delphinella strobiligena]|nr:hypothetical protein BDV97DRAFT_370216 [Delphinella strobiligena]
MHGRTPLGCLYLSEEQYCDPDHILLLQNLLKYNFDAGVETFNDECVETTLYWPRYAISLLHEQVWPLYQNVTLLQRLKYALKYLNRRTSQPLMDFEARLGCKLLQHEVLDTAVANDAILGFLATIMRAYGYSKAFARRHGPETETGGWSDVLVGAITRNVDLQDRRCRDLSSGCRTAMTNFVQGWIEDGYFDSWLKDCHIYSKDMIGNAVYTWFHGLDDLDIDLDAFANSESKALEAAARGSTSSYLTLPQARHEPHLSWVITLHGMEKSSRSGHWKLCFEWPPRRLYQFLGLPRPSSGVPGAWGSWDSTDEEPDTWEEYLESLRTYQELRPKCWRNLPEKAHDESDGQCDTSRIVEADENSDEEIDQESDDGCENDKRMISFAFCPCFHFEVSSNTFLTFNNSIRTLHHWFGSELPSRTQGLRVRARLYQYLLASVDMGLLQSCP